MNGLSSGALQKTTSFAHPRLSLFFVFSAVSSMTRPIVLTASMFIPVFVDPTLTEEQTRSVCDSASGIDLIRSSSAGVIPFETSAENPPMKLTPTVFAALSSVFAMRTKSSVVLQHPAPTSETGVTEILLLTIGIPNSFSISSPTETRSFAFDVIFAYIFPQTVSMSESQQSRRLIPIVIVLTSSF